MRPTVRILASAFLGVLILAGSARATWIEGKVFCDAVVAEAGIAALNRVWDSPESLPTPQELERPSEWLARVGSAPAAA